jgi:hypothetical protein
MSCAKVEAKMAVFGYARVSTDGQSLASQDAQLRAGGCAKVVGPQGKMGPAICR